MGTLTTTGDVEQFLYDRCAASRVQVCLPQTRLLQMLEVRYDGLLERSDVHALLRRRLPAYFSISVVPFLESGTDLMHVIEDIAAETFTSEDAARMIKGEHPAFKRVARWRVSERRHPAAKHCAVFKHLVTGQHYRVTSFVSLRHDRVCLQPVPVKRVGKGPRDWVRDTEAEARA